MKATTKRMTVKMAKAMKIPALVEVYVITAGGEHVITNVQNPDMLTGEEIAAVEMAKIDSSAQFARVRDANTTRATPSSDPEYRVFAQRGVFTSRS